MCKTGICFLILFSCLRATAIEAVVSHTVFYVNDPAQNNQLKPNLETYWQVNPRSVHYTTTPQKNIIARIKTDIAFTNDAGIIKEDHFILQTVPCTINELNTRSIIELRRYCVGNGLIKMKITLTDQADTTNKFSYTDSFTISPPTDVAFFSGLQMIDTVIESSTKSTFSKNGHQQIPACSNFFDDSKKTLHYYAELYETDQVSKGDYPLIQKVSISKKPNDTYYGNFIKKDTITPGKISLASGSFSLATLPSGNYYLNISLENNTHKTITSGNLFFQVMNLHPAEEEIVKKVSDPANDTVIENVTVLDLDKTFLHKYKIGEVLAMLKMLLPVSDPMETQNINNFLKKPDDMYMRYYIYNHFKAIDQKDPGKAWKDYSEKVIEVNKRFSEHGTKGYSTERGFMYLRYGEPTEIITIENESGTLPYEIWQYNTLTQMNHKDITDAIFLFYKRDDLLSDYQLLHSNVSGETQNKAWRSFLYVSGQGGNNANSRAEQYIGNK